MLTIEEYRELSRLRNKIAHRQNINYNEVLQYVRLIQKEGPKGQQEIRGLMQKTGAYTVEELATKLTSPKNDNAKLLEGLLYAGLGILLGFALIEAMKK